MKSLRFLYVLLIAGTIPTVSIAQNTSATLSIKPKEARPIIAAAAKLNSLNDDAVTPWHLAATYSEFDDKSNVIDQGTIDVFWAATNHYKVVYQGSKSSYISYVTASGVNFTGVQQPSHILAYIAKEFLQPIPFPADVLKHFNFRIDSKVIQAMELRCATLLNPKPETEGGFLTPIYCLDVDNPILRIGSHQFITHHYVRSNHTLFQGRYIPNDIAMDGDLAPILRVHLTILEPLSDIKAADYGNLPQVLGSAGSPP